MIVEGPGAGRRASAATWVEAVLAAPPFVLGTTALVGWAGGSHALETMRLEGVTMKANTAVAVVALALALGALARPPRELLRRAADAAGALAALIGAATLLEYALDRSLGIDDLLFHQPAGVLGTSAPARTSPYGAVALLLLGAGLLLRDRRRRGIWPGRVLASGAGAIGTLALIGHAASVSALSGFAGKTQTSLPAAVAIVFLALGELAHRPPGDEPPRLLSPGVAGRLLRRLLPFSIALPILLGGLRLAGQESGLYGTALGTWLFVAALVAAVSLGVWLVAVRFEATDAARATAEQRLAAVESRQRVLLEHLPGTAVVSVDAELRFTFLSGAGTARAVLFPGSEIGGSLEAVLGDEEAWLIRPHVLAALAGQPQSFDFSSGRAARDYTVEVVPLQEGGAMLVARDVTERRRLEERAREAQRQEGVALLAGGVAHDFNNLLMAALGNAETVAAQLPEGSPLRRQAEAIVLAAQQGAELTRSLLAYAGRGSRVESDVALTALVHDVAELVRSIVPQEIDLDLDLDEALPRVRGDSSQLQQVALNLIVNASEAVGARMGRIVVRTLLVEGDEAFLDSLALADPPPEPGPFVCLEVADTGSGIETDDRGRIFDPFFTTKFTGHGLGLAAVLGIVHAHGGGIRVASEPGRGSTFLVAFPAAAAPEPPRPAEPAPWTASGLVLLVDDDEVVRDVTAQALARLGLTVVTAERGQEAISLLTAVPKDVTAAIVDLRMPGMPGGEVAAALRAIRPDLPILITSGSPEDALPEELRIEPGIQFLQKPFRANALAAHLRRLLAWTASGAL